MRLARVPTCSATRSCFEPASPAQGQVDSIDGSYVIVDIVPPGLTLPYRAADIWISRPLDRQNVAGTGPLVFARLRPDATIDPASSEVQAITQGMSAQFPERAGL